MFRQFISAQPSNRLKCILHLIYTIPDHDHILNVWELRLYLIQLMHLSSYEEIPFSDIMRLIHLEKPNLYTATKLAINQYPLKSLFETKEEPISVM